MMLDEDKVFLPPIESELPSKVKFASPVIAFDPVTVTSVLFVEPVNTALFDAVPVKFPTNVVAVTTPDITCGPPMI